MMTKLNLMKPILAAVCTALFSFSLSAQVVKNDRLLSFEQPELPAGLSATKATLGISDQHYKDGTHSLRWTFESGSVLTLQRDLKFEKKDPTGKIFWRLVLASCWCWASRSGQPRSSR